MPKKFEHFVLPEGVKLLGSRDDSTIVFVATDIDVVTSFLNFLDLQIRFNRTEKCLDLFDEDQNVHGKAFPWTHFPLAQEPFGISMGVNVDYFIKEATRDCNCVHESG